MLDQAKTAAGLRTRASVLDAAYRLFLRQGFHGTSMRQIAQEAGISLGAAYNHFPAKYDIFRCLLAERNPYAALAETLAAIQGDSAATLLGQGMTEAVRIFSGNPDFIRLVFIDAIEFQGATVGEVAGGIFPRILAFFQRVVAVGRASGELREVSPVIMMRAFAGLMMSGVALETAMRPLAEFLRVEDWRKGYVDILLHGVLRPAEEGKVNDK